MTKKALSRAGIEPALSGCTGPDVNPSDRNFGNPVRHAYSGGRSPDQNLQFRWSSLQIQEKKVVHYLFLTAMPESLTRNPANKAKTALVLFPIVL